MVLLRNESSKSVRLTDLIFNKANMFQDSEEMVSAKARFLAAAHRGNLTVMRRILDENKEKKEVILMARDPHLFSTGLHFACEKGYLDLVFYFLELKNKDLLQSKDKLGRSALH